MVTHEEEVAAHATRIIRMRDGRVASDLAAAEDRARRASAEGPTDKAKEGRP
jgi:ABC-type lipoprotein export system ATPase subunit